MKVIEPSVEILTPIDGSEIIKHIELCGRICYKSEDRITDDSCEKFVESILNKEHLSVLEHYNFTAKFICDRGVSHEIVRHRIASYSQESTRYANYSNDRFGNEITVVKPCFWDSKSSEYLQWEKVMRYIDEMYIQLLRTGAKPEEARSILPNSLKTEVVMTANLREWRHFFELRCDKAAHPQMRQVATMLLKKVHDKIPVVFDDIYERFVGGTENE